MAINATRFNYDSAQAEVSDVNGVCRITIRGVVTDRVRRHMLHDLGLWGLAAGVVVKVSDYRGAVLCLSAETMAEAAVAVGGTFLLPTAMIVTAGQESLFCAYAHLMSRSGICRAPFLSEPRAIRWALAQALTVRSLHGQRSPS